LPIGCLRVERRQLFLQLREIWSRARGGFRNGLANFSRREVLRALYGDSPQFSFSHSQAHDAGVDRLLWNVDEHRSKPCGVIRLLELRARLLNDIEVFSRTQMRIDRALDAILRQQRVAEYAVLEHVERVAALFRRLRVR
jgi:hypothetical protein